MHSYLDQIILTYKNIVYILFSFFYFTAQYMSLVAISSVIIILLYCVSVKLVKGKTCCYHEFQHFIIRNTTKSNATLSEQYLNTTQNLERMVQCQHRSPQDIKDGVAKAMFVRRLYTTIMQTGCNCLYSTPPNSHYQRMFHQEELLYFTEILHCRHYLYILYQHLIQECQHLAGPKCDTKGKPLPMYICYISVFIPLV